VQVEMRPLSIESSGFDAKVMCEMIDSLYLRFFSFLFALAMALSVGRRRVSGIQR